MESPIYKLEKVVQGKEELQDFEGPLDLILFLLSKNKIEIQDIPIALILDQYLAYLDRRKEMDLEVASEFVTMAAHLMYIKTRMLLSLEDEEAKNEMGRPDPVPGGAPAGRGLCPGAPPGGAAGPHGRVWPQHPDPGPRAYGAGQGI